MPLSFVGNLGLMRLLVADKIAPEPLAELAIVGVEVIHEPTLTTEDLPAALVDVDILVVRSTRVTSEAIENTDPGECNHGFMRPDAMLHIIMVSDEVNHGKSLVLKQNPWMTSSRV